MARSSLPSLAPTRKPLLESIVEESASAVDSAPAYGPSARLCILDALRAVVTGWDDPRTATVAAEFGVRPDERGDDLMLRGPVQQEIPVLAFAAAASSVGDTHTLSGTHPGSVVVPVTLWATHALAGTLATTALHRAVALGYEVTTRIGTVLRHHCPPTRGSSGRALRMTPVAGAAGAAVAALSLLRPSVSTRQLVSAASLALQAAQGLNQWTLDGTDDDVAQTALAASVAVSSARLAAAGVSGAEHVLDGPLGLLALIGGDLADPTPALTGALAVDGLVRKLREACLHGQTVGLLGVALGQSLGDAVERIERVQVFASATAAAYPGCDNTVGLDERQRQVLSLQFCTAAGLLDAALDGPVERDSFESRAIDLAERCTVTVDPHLGVLEARLHVWIAGRIDPVRRQTTLREAGSTEIESALRRQLGRHHDAAGIERVLAHPLLAGA